MATNERTMVFLTTGSEDSLAALPSLNTLTATLGYQLAVLHMLRDDERASEQQLAAALATLPSDTAQPSVLAVRPGDIGSALAGFASVKGSMLAFLPRRPRFAGRLLVGNEFEQLLRTGPLPLLALPKSGRIPPIQRVLFTADYSPRSAAAFDDAVFLCEQLNAELHLLHVYGEDRLLPSELDLERRRAASSPGELFAIDQEQMQLLVAQAKAHGVRVRSELAEGRAHAQILAYAAAKSVSMIVMSSHGPRTMEDILIGSTTMRVIQRTPVPVLALRS